MGEQAMFVWREIEGKSRNSLGRRRRMPRPHSFEQQRQQEDQRLQRKQEDNFSQENHQAKVWLKRFMGLWAKREFCQYFEALHPKIKLPWIQPSRKYKCVAAQ